MDGPVIAMGTQIDHRRSSRQINVILRQQEKKVQVTEHVEKLSASTKRLTWHTHFQDIQQELDKLVGLHTIKELIFEMFAYLQVTQMRSQAGLHSSAHVYHMIFKGNPGTGKTTVARIMARLFQKLGLLHKGHLIEVERADLVGEYIGHTAQKTRDLVKKALGGVLFIDEAYSLARGGEKDFGKEAIDTLVKSMEDHKNQFILILAGYYEEMDDFEKSNPGLPSRFPIQVEFPDYSVDELIQISELIVKEREYILLPQTIHKLKHRLVQQKSNGIHPFSNARYVRNVIERSIRHQAVRLLEQYDETVQPTKSELMTICIEDLNFDK